MKRFSRRPAWFYYQCPCCTQQARTAKPMPAVDGSVAGPATGRGRPVDPVGFEAELAKGVPPAGELEAALVSTDRDRRAWALAWLRWGGSTQFTPNTVVSVAAERLKEFGAGDDLEILLAVIKVQPELREALAKECLAQLRQEPMTPGLLAELLVHCGGAETAAVEEFIIEALHSSSVGLFDAALCVAEKCEPGQLGRDCLRRLRQALRGRDARARRRAARMLVEVAEELHPVFGPSGLRWGLRHRDPRVRLVAVEAGSQAGRFGARSLRKALAGLLLTPVKWVRIEALRMLLEFALPGS